MSLYNFKRLIKKYSKFPVFVSRESPGHNDYSQGGIWIPGGLEEIEIEGAVAPLSNQDLKFDEGGTYNQEDRKLYCYIDVEKGEKIKHKGKTYTVLEKRDYEDFDTGLNIYFVKRGEVD